MNTNAIIRYVLAALLIILFGSFVYPGIYEYDKFNQKMLVKINRITGHTQVLNGDKWVTVTDSDLTKSDEVALLKEELSKNREQLKKELVKEIRQDIIKDVTNELESVKQEITTYKKFEMDPQNYFSIGSTKDDVKKIMGTPTATNDYLGTWNYGLSTVTFSNGKVKEYNNYSKNLRIK